MQANSSSIGGSISMKDYIVVKFSLKHDNKVATRTRLMFILFKGLRIS